MQEGHRRCSCYPGYLRPSNNSCQGESLSCFRDVLYHLGHFPKIVIGTKTFLQDRIGQLLVEVRRRPACQPVLTKLLMSLSQATLFQVEKVSITENSFAELSGKSYFFFVLTFSSSKIQFRKLSRLSCNDKYSLKAFENHYPNLCKEIKYFLNINSCDQNGNWVARDASTDKSRRKDFEQSILRLDFK